MHRAGSIARARTSCRPAVALGLVLIALLNGCVGPTRPPVPAPTREGRWRQDLHYMATNLKRLHKNLFFKTTEDEFDEVVQALDRSIDSMGDHEIIVEFMRIVALVGDDHTRLSWRANSVMRTYPLRLEWFSDGLYVIRAAEEHRRALRCRLVRIGRNDIREVCAALRELIPHENDAAFKWFAPSYLAVPEILHALAYVPDIERGAFVFQDTDGQEFTLELAPTLRGGSSDVSWVSAVDWEKVPKPLYLKKDTLYWFEYLEDSKTLYCQYNRCRNMRDYPFSAFAADLLKVLDAQPVERFVLDLRRNPGGNSEVIKPLRERLAKHDRISRKGRLFVLIGRKTFSSAAKNTIQLRRRTEAIFVGEPTGQKPNTFGEIKRFELPNSKIPVSYSTKYFRMMADDPASFVPDIRVDLSSADYFAGRDPVLEAVLAHDME